MRKAIFISLILSSFLALSAEPAPNFTLKDLSGAPVSLSGCKGKIVVVDFWATWCASCKEAFGELNTLQTTFKDKDVVVVGVNLEKINPQKTAAFVKKSGINYTVLLDAEMATAKLYQIKGVPSLVVIDRELNVVKMFRGMNKTTEKEISDLLTQLTAGGAKQ
jgi:peroxiredoxin